MKKYIYNFEELSELLDTKDKKTYIYACLLWLGVAPNDMHNVIAECFNETMHTLNVRYRTVFIKEKRINDALVEFKSCLPITPQDRRRADEFLSECALDWKYIYKMQLLAKKYELEKSGQPEDIILFREMITVLGKSNDQIKAEYADYKEFIKKI